MDRGFPNVYDDPVRSAAYDALEFPGTYGLAFRDLPGILRRHVRGRRAVDFGCGAGRSTRFLRQEGFHPIGVDIAEPMLLRARERDPAGEYRLIPDGDLSGLPTGETDLVLAAFTFDNVPTLEKKATLFGALRALLAPDGRIVTVVSAPAIYVNEWASFSTKDFPENRQAVCGDRVRIVMLDVPDRRPVEDILCTDEGYAEAHGRAGLAPVATFRPLGRAGDGCRWVSETTISPWVIYVLRANKDVKA